MYEIVSIVCISNKNPDDHTKYNNNNNNNKNPQECNMHATVYGVVKLLDCIIVNQPNFPNKCRLLHILQQFVDIISID